MGLKFLYFAQDCFRGSGWIFSGAYCWYSLAEFSNLGAKEHDYSVAVLLSRWGGGGEGW